ncbi:response regulator [Candidatus Woesearchaeota archaeon]|nr:response regulator [Candidatus Woesearchaeota archaeon]
MPKRVLIIEDEPNIAEAERLVLESDYEVHVAPDGDMGLEMAKKLQPDLIVLDLMLPNRGGYDVSFNIRQHNKLKDTKIIMVTALNQPIDRKKGEMVGTDIYMTKPFEPDDLMNNVKRLLRD